MYFVLIFSQPLRLLGGEVDRMTIYDEKNLLPSLGQTSRSKNP